MRRNRSAEKKEMQELTTLHPGIVLTGIVFSLFFLLLGARAFFLHLTDNQKLNRLTRTQYKRRIVVAPKRGNILDRNGEGNQVNFRRTATILHRLRRG